MASPKVKINFVKYCALCGSEFFRRDDEQIQSFRTRKISANKALLAKLTKRLKRRLKRREKLSTPK